jgi:hypothetical protein
MGDRVWFSTVHDTRLKPDDYEFSQFSWLELTNSGFNGTKNQTIYKPSTYPPAKMQENDLTGDRKEKYNQLSRHFFIDVFWRVKTMKLVLDLEFRKVNKLESNLYQVETVDGEVTFPWGGYTAYIDYDGELVESEKPEREVDIVRGITWPNNSFFSDGIGGSSEVYWSNSNDDSVAPPENVQGSFTHTVRDYDLDSEVVTERTWEQKDGVRFEFSGALDGDWYGWCRPLDISTGFITDHKLDDVEGRYLKSPNPIKFWKDHPSGGFEQDFYFFNSLANTTTGEIVKSKFEMTPVEYWPYADSNGDPIYNTTTGARLRNPLG